jgi:inorganic pyrophosphatase
MDIKGFHHPGKGDHRMGFPHCKRLAGLALACLLLLAACASTAQRGAVGHADGLKMADGHTLIGEKDFLRDYPPTDSSGNITVVVEIPAGTNAKWEVDKETGQLKWEFKKEKPRIVAYLGYPGNYGMIPRTILPKEQGGDGDPLDVIVLSPGVPRGSVVTARPIGVLKLLDGGEQDDKIIAVLPDSPLGGVSSLEELQSEFKGITDILEIWFSNYKGPGEMESKGFGDAAKARDIINDAVEAYEQKFSTAQ